MKKLDRGDYRYDEVDQASPAVIAYVIIALGLAFVLGFLL